MAQPMKPMRPEFKDRVLSPEAAQSLKDFVQTNHNTSLYVSKLPDGLPLYWRGMTRIEYENLMSSMSQEKTEVNQYQFQNMIVQRIIMHPQVGLLPGMVDIASLPAGVPSSLYEQFMFNMGFDVDSLQTIQL